MNTFTTIMSSLIGIFLPGVALAHTRYVVSPQELAALNLAPHTGLEAVSSVGNILIIAGTIGLVSVLYTVSLQSSALVHKLQAIKLVLKDYRQYVPWILRISLGILLISSSAHHTLVSPVISNYALSFAQFVLGFTLLAGFATTIGMLLTLCLYVTALFTDWYVLGNFEVLGAALAYLAIGIARPGIDDIVSIPHINMPKLRWLAPIIMRVSLGISFLFLALYEKFWNLNLSFAVVEKFNLTSVIPVSAEMWVFSAGVIELFLGIAYILGFRVRLMAAISFVVITITLFGLREDVSAHITLFGIISALFITGAGRFSIDSWIAPNSINAILHQ
jgi:uncharacterized membrane protein YphA (DoxX/SURF4 family)